MILLLYYKQVCVCIDANSGNVNGNCVLQEIHMLLDNRLLFFTSFQINVKIVAFDKSPQFRDQIYFQQFSFFLFAITFLPFPDLGCIHIYWPSYFFVLLLFRSLLCAMFICEFSDESNFFFLFNVCIVLTGFYFGIVANVSV